MFLVWFQRGESAKVRAHDVSQTTAVDESSAYLVTHKISHPRGKSWEEFPCRVSPEQVGGRAHTTEMVVLERNRPDMF